MAIFSNMKIGTKLVGGICALLILSCVGMSVMSYRAGSAALEKTITEALPTLAEESAKYIRTRLDNYIVSAEAIASRNVIRSMDWAQQAPALEAETKRLGCQGMGIVMPDGTAKYPDGTTAPLGDRDYVQAAFRGETVLSDVIISRVTKQPVMMLGTPIRAQDGSVAAVLVVRYDGFFLSEITKEIKYGQQGYSYVINGKGVLIAHNNRDYVLQQKNFVEEAKTNPADFGLLAAMMKRMINRERGFDEYWFINADRMFGYAPISGTDWSIAIGAMKDDVFADVYAMRNQFIYVTAIFILIGFIISFIFARSISRPVMAGVGYLLTVSEKGDLSHDVDNGYMTRGDEIGQLARAVQGLIEAQRVQAGLAKKMSAGDWNIEVPVRSAEDELGRSLSEMVVQMNSTLLAVNNAAVQVDSGSEQIAASSQSLSQGATESAASLQEISASMTQIGAQTKHNAENAQQANTLATEARTAAQRGSQHMGEMVAAMKDIDSSSQQISKIIKAIDDIAFQTNLLALNAAVEAARAGRHGKGFAVVAEEVRNLAARSAKAAKETAELIESSGAKVGKGTQIAAQTEKALVEIVEGITKAADLVSEIAAASNEQAEGVSQVSIGLGQIDSVTQQNTANAEETASSSEELSDQARQLKQLLTRFRLKGGQESSVARPGQAFRDAPAPRPAMPGGSKPRQIPLPSKRSEPLTVNPREEIKLDDDEFGKF